MFLCLSFGTMAQEVAYSPFCSPFDFPLYLAGNFGELRPNHFHGGLDIKTQGVVGKPVHAIADGYVSRISVSPTGYGNALYVTHPNGYTSVYGHLDRFNELITNYVEDYQYAHETFSVEIYPDTTQFVYHQGDVIAYSGNTGSSGGPHLHLEIRQTATNEMLDPMPFFKHLLKDTKPPLSSTVMLYAPQGEGVINGRSGQQSFAWASNRKAINQTVQAWGKIGIGIRAYDYMNETTNIYGVRQMVLTVDGKEIFRSLVDRISFDENRAINSWVDYAEYKRRHTWYTKSFIEPGNPLRLLHSNTNRGWVTIDEERDYHFRYVLEDAFGNQSTYEFTIMGRPQTISHDSLPDSQLLRWDKVNILQRPGMQLVIPKNRLYRDVPAQVTLTTDSNAIAYTYQIHSQPEPLHTYASLKIKLRHTPVNDTTKYYIAQQSGNETTYVGGTYANGWIEAKIRELGTFTVCADTIPPLVRLLSHSRTQLVYRIQDSQSGIASYRGTIDGKFVLLEYSARDRQLVCHFRKARVARSGQHDFELQVIDRCGNVTTVRQILSF